MKYIDEYRDRELAQRLSGELGRITTREWTIMEVCGGQTHSILQFGIEDLLPERVQLVHGPGCPVCVTPISLIDKAIALANRPSTILCSFGDMLRVPGSKIDLMGAKTQGADVRMVYSPLDALSLAQKHPDKTVVFFAVGFETTAPANAMAVKQAKRLGLSNFYFLSSHVRVPPVCAALLQSPDNKVQGFIGPGHVCTVMGLQEYEEIAELHKTPIVVAGFEPLDILEGILICVSQLEKGEHGVVNQYSRVVERYGNVEALKILDEVFTIVDREWRGMGWIAQSGFGLSEEYSAFDAEKLLGANDFVSSEENSECISGQILKGILKPTDCTAFGTRCTPETPLGATMVSSEGTCANYYKFRRFDLEKCNANL